MLTSIFPITMSPSGSFPRLNDRQALALHASLLPPKGTGNGWSTKSWHTNMMSILLSRFFRTERYVTSYISLLPSEVVVMGCHLSWCLLHSYFVFRTMFVHTAKHEKSRKKIRLPGNMWRLPLTHNYALSQRLIPEWNKIAHVECLWSTQDTGHPDHNVAWTALLDNIN